MLEIENDGPNIARSNYWESDYARSGKVLLSANAGTIRLLVPEDFGDLRELEASLFVICSVGSWSEAGYKQSVELLFEDDSDSPYRIHLSPESCTTIPGPPAEGSDCLFAVWGQIVRKPTKWVEKLCKYRKVKALPCMQRWEESQLRELRHG